MMSGTSNPPNTPRPLDNAEFKKWLGAHPKYKRSVDVDTYIWCYWREKSKGGIEWATTVAKKHIHFCIDRMATAQFTKSITEKSFLNVREEGQDETQFKTNKSANTNSVANNTNSPKSAVTVDSFTWTEKYRNITNAELRWIYRNQKVQGVRDHVQFWFELKPCPPPWVMGDEAVKNLWKAYKDI